MARERRRAQLSNTDRGGPRAAWLLRLLVATALASCAQAATSDFAAAASAKDCIALDNTDVEDALTYRNDCNRAVIFYYCVVDPKRSEVAPCRRVISGTRRVLTQGSRGQLFLMQEMEPRMSYDIKLWGGSKIKWAACDAELGGLELFQPRGNAALDFSYECAE